MAKKGLDRPSVRPSPAERSRHDNGVNQKKVDRICLEVCGWSVEGKWSNPKLQTSHQGKMKIDGGEKGTRGGKIPFEIWNMKVESCHLPDKPRKGGSGLRVLWGKEKRLLYRRTFVLETRRNGTRINFYWSRPEGRRVSVLSGRETIQGKSRVARFLEPARKADKKNRGRMKQTFLEIPTRKEKEGGICLPDKGRKRTSRRLSAKGNKKRRDGGGWDPLRQKRGMKPELK